MCKEKQILIPGEIIDMGSCAQCEELKEMLDKSISAKLRLIEVLEYFSKLVGK